MKKSTATSAGSSSRSNPVHRVFSTLGRISPALAGRLAAFLWYRTRKRHIKGSEKRIMEQASTQLRKCGGKSVYVYQWGKGPHVLLTHGWNGSAAQMTPLVEALVDEGFHVTAFDAPGHGRSSGNSTDIEEISACIKDLLEETGKETSVIAHSFGCMCALNTISGGADVRSVVCIAPPKNVTTLLHRFTRLLGLGTATVRVLKERLEHRFGEDMWSRFSIPQRVQSTDIQGLIIHDARDHHIPVSNGKHVHAAWSGSELKITRGLGHTRILQSAEVISSIKQFLASQSQTVMKP